MAQIVAYNDNRRRRPLAVICGHVEGPTLRELDEEAKSAIPPKDYVGLLQTFQIMQESGLGIEDPADANIKHTLSRFVIVDYELDPAQTLAQKVAAFGSMLLDDVYYKDPIPDYGLLYRDVCAEMLGGDIAAAVEDRWRRERFVQF